MREPKGIRIMSVTATQSAVTIVQHETTVLRQPQPIVPRRDATSLSAAFAEQPTARRLDEWAAALDFPLDFQI
jgi:hypothetical protein